MSAPGSSQSTSAHGATRNSLARLIDTGFGLALLGWGHASVSGGSSVLGAGGDTMTCWHGVGAMGGTA